MNTTTKNIILTVIMGALLFSYAQPAQAGIPVSNIPGIPPDILTSVQQLIGTITNIAQLAIDVYMKIKDVVLDPAAWVMSKLQLNEEANTILTQVQGGGNARPETGKGLFVTDWQHFTDTARNNASENFLQDLEATNKVDPAFKETFLDSLRNNDRRSAFSRNQSTFASDVGCDAPDNPDGSSPCLGNYLQDFSQGGWQGWNSIVEKPGSNPYLSYLSLQDEKRNLEQSAVQARRDEAFASGGALGTQKCEDLPSEEGGNPIPNAKCFITRPGSTVTGDLSKVLGGPMDTLQQVDEFAELLAGAFSSLIGAIRGQGVTQEDGSPDIIQSSREALDAESQDAALKIIEKLAVAVNKTLGDLDAIWQTKVKALDAIDDIPTGLIDEIKTTQYDVASGGQCAHHPDAYESLDDDLADARQKMNKLVAQVGVPVDFANPINGAGPSIGDFEAGGLYSQELFQKQSDLEYLRQVIDDPDTPPSIQASDDVTKIYQNPNLTTKERLRMAQQLVGVEFGIITELLLQIGDPDAAQAELSGISSLVRGQRQSRRTCYDHGH